MMIKSLARKRHLSYLSRRLLDSPLAIEEGAATVLLSALSERLGIDRRASFDDDFIEPAGEYPDQDARPYEVCDGVAIIPILGELCQRGGHLDAMSGLTSYGSILSSVKAAVDDTSIKGIMLDIDSPGGEIAGLFDTVDALNALKGSKPIWAFSNERCFSAAYALASFADRILVSRTSGVGSIGVICWHTDRSVQMRQQGVKVTPIYSGSLKADGNEFGPLMPETKARFQKEVDSAYALFCGTVSRLRGLDEQAVRDTEAGVFYGPDGIAAGLADEVSSFGDALRALSGQTESNPVDNLLGASNMADEENKITGEFYDVDGNPVIPQEDGTYIDEDGNVVDELFDVDGNPITAEGEEEVLEGLTDDQGRLIDEEGNLIDEDGNLVDEDGNPIVKEEPAAKKGSKAEDNIDKVSARRAVANRTAANAGIVRVCNAGGYPELSEDLIRKGASVADAKRALTRQGAIKGLIMKGSRMDPSMKEAAVQKQIMAKAGGDISKARQIILDRAASASARSKVSAFTPNGSQIAAQNAQSSRDSILEKRKARDAAALNRK